MKVNKKASRGVLMVIGLLLIVLVAVITGACASVTHTHGKNQTMPYSYPYWAMPHGDEIIPSRPIEVEPIPLPIVPSLPKLH